jgi:hypothetical protein
MDGAILGFEVLLGSIRFSYQWHIVPPQGWEPIAQWFDQVVGTLTQALDNAPHASEQGLPERQPE